MAARVCSECGKSLAGKGPKATTCSDTCRSRRFRRLNQLNATEQPVEHMREAMQVLSSQNIDQAIRKVAEQELAPVVREAITEDVMRAINSLVGLTPKAVAALSADLESDDDLVRQKATALALKYTVGHPALVQHEDANPAASMTVNFNLPRPGAEDVIEATVDDVPEDSKECDMCGATKPARDFVANSSRCITCYDNWRDTILKQYSESSPTAP